MTKTSMPGVLANRLPGVRSDITVKALEAWNPDVRAVTSAQNEDNVASISILDTIGKDWYGDGVTAKRISAALRSIGDKDVDVYINSPGGDLFEGLAIYSLLREHPGKVTVKILGLAASAASVIALAADEVRIMRSGFFMIHNAWVCACGDRNAFREVADWLEPFDDSLVSIYAARTGISDDDLRAMLDKETWIGGAAAVEQGFADDLLASDQAEADTKNSSDISPTAARKKADILMARGNAPRSLRRELLASLKGTQIAAPDTPSAVDISLGDILALMKQT